MRIKLDENLPARIAADLDFRGHDVHTTIAEGLSGKPDQDIWQAAKRENRVLITQDLDFSDARSFIPGSHPGIVLLRLRSPSRVKLVSRVLELFDTENVNAWTGCFVVVTEQKVRVRKPRP